VRLIRLRAGTIRRLRELERTPSPDPWVAEVESFILDGGAASHRLEPLSAILLADDAGRAIGAAVHHPAGRLAGAQYISAVLLDHRYRGRGLGDELFRAVIADARSTSGRPYVTWVVHPDNAPMIALSRRVVSEHVEIGTQQATGYLIFVDP
jgi:RimJ/RimL family protein N-acetyltransferase